MNATEKDGKHIKEFLKTIKTKPCKGELGNVMVTEMAAPPTLTKSKNI